MSESLGSLVISVAADLAGFKKGMSDGEYSARQMAANVQRSVADISSSFDSLVDRLTGVAAALGVAFSVDRLLEFSRTVIETNGHIHELSEQLGIGARALTVYAAVAAETGGNTEDLATQLSHLEKNAALAAHGNEQFAAAFSAIGVSVTDANGKLKNAETLLDEVATAMAGYKDGIGKAQVAQALFGKGGAQMIAFLDELGVSVDDAKEKAIALGIVLSDDDAKAFNKLSTTFTDIGLAIKGQFTQALLAVLPSLQSAADKILSFIENSSTLKTIIADAAAVFAFLADHLDAVATALKSIAAIGAASMFLSMAESALKFGAKMLIAGQNAVTLKTAVAAIPAAIAAWDIGSAVGRWLNSFQVVRNSAVQLVAALDAGWQLVKAGFEIVNAAISASWNTMIQGLKNSLASFLEVMSKATFGPASAELNAYAISLRAADPAQKTFAQSAAEIGANLKTNLSIDRQVINDMMSYTDSVAKGSAVLGSFSVETDGAKRALDGFNPKAAQMADKLDAARASAQKLLDTIEGIGQGTAMKAVDDYVARIDQIMVEYDKLAKAHESEANLQAFLTEALDKNDAAFERQNAEIEKSLDFMTNLETKYKNQAYLLGLSSTARQVEAVATQEQERALQELQKAYGPMAQLTQDQIDKIHGLAAEYVAFEEQIKNNESIVKDWAGITSSAFTQAFDAINKDIVEGGSVMKDLVNVAKQTVLAIIAEFEKLAIINPLLNAIFGGSSGFSMLPTMFGGGASGGSGLVGMLAGQGGGGGGLFGSLFGGGAGVGAPGGLFGSFFGGGSTSGGLGAAQQALSGLNSANGLMGWLFGSQGSSSLGGFGALADWGAGMDTGGSPLLNALGITDYTGDAAVGAATSSTSPVGALGGNLGYYMGIAGGVLAGFNEFKSAGGGLGGLLGGAAYGIGSITLGGAIAGGLGALGGGIGAAGAGAAAGGSAAAAGIGVIPVIGWIAAAAMLVNMISGGKLFGTGWQPVGSHTNVDVGATGASIANWIIEKKQGALFSGAKWTAKSAPVDPAAQAAMDAFFTSLQNAVAAGATALGEQVPAIIGGSFVETFDKHGNMKSQISTVLGKQYNETLQDFEARVTGENLLALLPAAQNAQAIAAKWEASAQMLMQGAQFLLQAQVDINKGNGLLGDDQSLSDVDKITEKLAQANETLVQTYERLLAEEKDVQKYFDLLGFTSTKTGADFVQLADDMATAAGGVQNLDKIQQTFFQEFYTASEQAAAMLASLQKDMTKQLAAIGETPGESLAKFKADFLAALPTLTGEQIVQWEQAGDALYQFITAATKAAQDVLEQKQIGAAFDALGLATGKTGDAFLQLASDMSDAAGGAQNLDKIENAFFQEFYSSAQNTAAAIAALNQSQADQLTAIGETPGESLGQFLADFTAALPTLSGAQILQWQQAGDALYQFITASTKAAEQIVAAKQAYGQFEEQLYGDQFLTSFSGIIAAEQQQIDKANQLAKAAGLAGASQQDLAEIMTAGSVQIQQAIAQLTSGIINDITAIYGARTIVAPQGALIFGFGQSQADLAAMQKKAETDSAALDLIQKLGDLEFVSGKSTAEILKQYGLTPGQLGKTLGISGDQITKDIEAAAKNAAALTSLAAASAEQTGIQEDILAAIQGNPLPYDISQLGAPNPVGAAGGNKPGVPGFGPGAHPLTAAVGTHTDMLFKSTSTLAGALARNTAALDQSTVATARAYRDRVTWPRNTRGTMGGLVLQP